MKFRTKLVLFLTVAAVIAIGAVLAPSGTFTPPPAGSGVGLATAAFSAGGVSAEVEAENLSMTITMEGSGRIWYSGKRQENDDYSDLWARKVTDGFTVGYRDTERGYSYERGVTSLGGRITLSEALDGCDARIELVNIGISFTANIRAEAGSVTVGVSFDSIQEQSDKFRLMYLIPNNYFDNSLGQTDGFIFVPDGSGALIDLSVSTTAEYPYSQRIYDGDRGVAGIKSKAYNVYAPQMPLYGAIYAGSGGYLAHIEGGAEYAEVNAYVPFGGENKYNYAYARFIYREEFTRFFESAGSEGKSYVAFQSDANRFDLKIRYLLLDESEDSLDAAAVRYREYLESTGILRKTAAGKTGLLLRYLISENKPSIFGTETLTMTRPDFITEELDALSSFCPNLKIALSGYTKGGISGSYPQHFPLEGGQAQYKRLLSAAAAKGIEVSFVTDFVQAYDDSSGYSKKDLAMSASEQFIGVNGIPNSTSAMAYSGFNALTVNKTKSSFGRDVTEFKKLGVKSLVFESIGGMLYSSFKNQSFSRTEQSGAYRELLADAGVVRNIALPNQYMWQVCDAFLDTPAAASGYMIESRAVPFLQMVLSGYMPMYRKPLNLNYLGSIEVLRMIDFNMYPAFLLTEENAIKLYGTQSAYIFTSEHSGWIDTVRDIYGRVSAVLDKVAGQRFVSRTEVAPQVFVNGYENGVRIYANYSGNDFTFEGKVLTAGSGGTL